MSFLSDTFNAFIVKNTPFQTAARNTTIGSKNYDKPTPKFKTFARKLGGFYQGIDLLKPLGLGYNEITDKIVAAKGRSFKQYEKKEIPFKLAQVAATVNKSVKINVSNFSKQKLANLIKQINVTKPVLMTIEQEVSEEGETGFRVIEKHYVLNKDTLTRLTSLLTSSVGESAESYSSSDAGVIAGGFSTVYSVSFKQLPPGKTSKPNGAFFKYTINESIPEFERYGIFSEVDPLNYDESCFIHALKCFPHVTPGTIDSIKTRVFSADVPMAAIKGIAEAYGLHITVKGFKNTKVMKHYGDVTQTPVALCLYDNHYFADEKTHVTSYAMKNYDALQLSHPDDWNVWRDKNKRTTTGFMSSICLFKLLLDDADVKKRFLTPIRFSEALYRTPHYEKVNEFASVLEVGADDCHPIVIKKKLRMNSYRVFFDSETNVYTGEKHVPYLCSYADDDGNTETFRGLGCCKTFFQRMHTKLVVREYRGVDGKQEPRVLHMVVHNLSYDYRACIFEQLTNLNNIEPNGRIIKGEGSFHNFTKEPLKVVMHCSYAKIGAALGRFGKMFNLSVAKEIMPYPVYNTDNISKQFIPLGECLMHLPENQHGAFISNCTKWNCVGVHEDVNATTLVDIITYSARYCEIDCLTLRGGYMKFQEMIREICDIDIDDYMTAASISNAFLLTKGCYKDCCEVSGVTRAFIQKCLVGGRTMMSENKRTNIGNDGRSKKEHNGKKGKRGGGEKGTRSNRKISDVDGVSLFPSAMVEMPGTIKGGAKVIPSELLDYSNLLKAADAFYVRIRVDKINIRRDFPLLSSVNKDGVRMFSNDLDGQMLYVDNIALADAIEFQGLEFEIIEGLYFDEGFNPRLQEVMQHLIDGRFIAKAEMHIMDGTVLKEVVKLTHEEVRGNREDLAGYVVEKMKGIRAAHPSCTVVKVKNPIEGVMKLLANSSYGVTCLRPIKDEIVYIPVKECEAYFVRNYNWIGDISYCTGGKLCRITRKKAINDHANRVHIGASILSWSKRIMNRTMCTAEDIGIKMMYTDTDSIHMNDGDIQPLGEAFEKKYGRRLYGENLGEFNSDFEMEDCKNVYSEALITLGKKCYCDALVGTDVETGETVRDYHFRMKGVSSGSIKYKCEELGISVYELYTKLSNGEAIEFDLMKDANRFGGNAVRFVNSKQMTISTNKKFTRVIQF